MEVTVYSPQAIVRDNRLEEDHVAVQQKSPRAAARLQEEWNNQFPDEPREIRKVYGPPKSKGSAGLTWAAIAPDGRWIDLGYTEPDASRYMRRRKRYPDLYR